MLTWNGNVEIELKGLHPPGRGGRAGFDRWLEVCCLLDAWSSACSMYVSKVLCIGLYTSRDGCKEDVSCVSWFLPLRYKDLVSQALELKERVVHDGEVVRRMNATNDGTGSHSQPRIAVMCSPGNAYVSAMFASWLMQGIFVPLCPSHPDSELEYVLHNADPAVIISDVYHLDRMVRLGSRANTPVHEVANNPPEISMSDVIDQSLGSIGMTKGQHGALLLYTSGTTGKPKGVLHTHSSLASQCQSLKLAWKISEKDRVLHALPLHHVHGVVNALMSPLTEGGTVEMLQKFSVGKIWDTIMRKDDPVSVFMGVPTMYNFLVKSFDSLETEAQRQAAIDGAKRLRLFLCGSAACPKPLMESWKRISGEYPLERYGMTEAGMILGNPMDPLQRQPGSVGLPFPGMEVEIRKDGQLYCRGGQIFSEYWGLPEETRECFDKDGWFQTGDIATIDDKGYISLLGRASADIIKRGGYKISALHIESAILEHELVHECSVFGVDDEEYGEAIVAVIAGDNSSSAEETLKSWLKAKLPPYQLPNRFIWVDNIPRNAMGKVNKKQLRQQMMLQM